MKWFIRLLKWVSWHHRIIPQRINALMKYLGRWYLIGGEEHKFFATVLHEFHCSDPTDLHDHEFPFISIILTGGYFEVTTAGRFWRGPGSILFRGTGEKYRHRIELDPKAGPVYTLVFFGPRRTDMEWGFYPKTGWMHHDEYFDYMKAKHHAKIR